MPLAREKSARRGGEERLILEKKKNHKPFLKNLEDDAGIIDEDKGDEEEGQEVCNFVDTYRYNTSV